MKLRLRLIQDKTKNGNIVKDHEMMNKKLLGRLEHQLQMSKIKLSTAKNENISLKSKVQDLRREKLLHIQILNDLVRQNKPLYLTLAIHYSPYFNLRQKRYQMLEEDRNTVRRRSFPSMRRSIK